MFIPVFALFFDSIDDLFQLFAGGAKTADNISPLYRFDSFDLIILSLYFSVLALLAVYGAYRIKQVIDFWRYRHIEPKPLREFDETELPRVTVQLPLYNEMYVVERLLKAVTAIDYPRERLEIQVLDDSTDETKDLARTIVERYQREGFDVHYIHRDDRMGFKAGALENGNYILRVFAADFFGNTTSEDINFVR